MSRRPTIRDVARAAGVSTVTVSRVANAPALVQATTRLKVERAMRELGYVPNVAARAMRTSTTRSIGCLLPDLVNFPNAAIAQAAERHLAAAGYCLLLAMSDYDTAAEIRALEALRTRQVDGFLLYVTDERAPALHEALARLDVPAVVLDRELPFASDALMSEHEAAMAKAVQHLTALGHRRLALVLPDLAIRPARERRQSFSAAAALAGLAPEAARIVPVAPADQERVEATAALLGDEAPPTAIIADGSRLMRSVLVGARACGLSIPSDLSLIGIDVADIAQATTPPLTAVSRDYALIGQSAAAMILERLATPAAAPRRLELPSEIILRGSCGPPPAD